VRRLRALWLALGVLGVVVLVGFDEPLTLAIGVACLLAFVAWGVALIATPGFIDAATPPARDPERPRRRR
jgi:drug/metabolite transporter (DMT)-like permease